MNKRVALCAALLLSSAPAFAELTPEMLKNLKTMGTAISIGGGAGYPLQKMNDEYTKAGKRPDLKMNAFKGLATAAVLATVDYHRGEHNLPENLAKLTAFGVSSLAFTDTAGELIEKVPVVNNIVGLLTDPKDRDGHEVKSFGALARFTFAYALTREIALEVVKNITKKQS
jgi:hypothetical protein